MQSFEAYLAERKTYELRRELARARKQVDKMAAAAATAKRRADEQLARVFPDRDRLQARIAQLQAELVALRDQNLIDRAPLHNRIAELQQQVTAISAMTFDVFEQHLNAVEAEARKRYFALLTQGEGFRPGDRWPPSTTIGEVRFRRLNSDLEMRAAGWLCRNCLSHSNQPYAERRRSGVRAYYAIIMVNKGYVAGTLELKRNEIGELAVEQARSSWNGPLSDAAAAALIQFVAIFAKATTKKETF